MMFLVGFKVNVRCVGSGSLKKIYMTFESLSSHAKALDNSTTLLKYINMSEVSS